MDTQGTSAKRTRATGAPTTTGATAAGFLRSAEARAPVFTAKTATGEDDASSEAPRRRPPATPAKHRRTPPLSLLQPARRPALPQAQVHQYRRLGRLLSHPHHRPVLLPRQTQRNRRQSHQYIHYTANSCMRKGDKPLLKSFRSAWWWWRRWCCSVALITS